MFSYKFYLVWKEFGWEEEEGVSCGEHRPKVRAGERQISPLVLAELMRTT